MRVLLTAMLLGLPALAFAGSVEVTASSLNVRTSAWGRVLGQLPQGTKLAARATSGGWHRVDYAGQSAYISATYTRSSSAPTLRVTASVLNVRSGPSTSNERIGQVRSGQEYVRLASRNGWSQIQYDHRTGWISEQYVNRNGLTDVLTGRTNDDATRGPNTTTNGSGNPIDSSGQPNQPGSQPNQPGSQPNQPGSQPNQPGNDSAADPADPNATQPGASTSALQRAHRGLTYMGAQIPRAGLYNSILRGNEPYGATRTYQGLPFVYGKISHFGGPNDRGVTSTETGTITGERLRSLNNPMSPSAAQLRSRPGDFYYVAMRWDYRPHGRTFWRRARLVVVAPSGRAVVVRPVDWGPHTRTRRILDLSPQATRDLGMTTDQSAYVAFVDPSTPLGPLR